jgi:hypothetical protein
MKRLDETGGGSPTEGAGVLRLRVCEEWELERYKELMVKYHYLKGGRSAGDTLR